jgi:hypothetical protein
MIFVERTELAPSLSDLSAHRDNAMTVERNCVGCVLEIPPHQQHAMNSTINCISGTRGDLFWLDGRWYLERDILFLFG